ncbi:MAG: potassium transporter TrkG, partial [Hydrogenophaga sp.]|nr:potassium transporter TrkG [Hydrogenophaga sp.]
MYSLLPVLSVFSRILVAFSSAFLVPLAWGWFLDADHHTFIWAKGFAITLASGLLLWWATRRHRRELMPKDGFMLVNLVWLVLPTYAAVPLMFTVPDITWTKAYFEAMSALTATGATALSGLDDLPVSANVWRC